MPKEVFDFVKEFWTPASKGGAKQGDAARTEEQAPAAGVIDIADTPRKLSSQHAQQASEGAQEAQQAAAREADGEQDCVLAQAKQQGADAGHVDDSPLQLVACDSRTNGKLGAGHSPARNGVKPPLMSLSTQPTELDLAGPAAAADAAAGASAEVLDVDAAANADDSQSEVCQCSALKLLCCDSAAVECCEA